MSDNIYKSYVYLFVLNNNISFKIGKSNNPKNRFNDLKSQYDFKEQFYVIECANEKKSYELETILHQTFSKFNIDCDSREFFEYDVYQNVCDLIENFTNHNLELMDASKPKKEPLGDLGLNKESVTSFCKLIQKRRKELGYTQHELANSIGCSRVTLGKIERDFNHKAYFQLYLKIADVLKIKVSFTYQESCKSLIPDIDDK